MGRFPCVLPSRKERQVARQLDNIPWIRSRQTWLGKRHFSRWQLRRFRVGVRGGDSTRIGILHLVLTQLSLTEGVLQCTPPPGSITLRSFILTAH